MIMRPLAEITDQAIRALNKELGLADTIRFLNQFRTRSGNYLEEREQLFGEKSLDEILAEIDEDRRRRDERRGSAHSVEVGAWFTREARP